tara:strand:- start:5050 stop:5913 length:864 start_codon:yes stop_codon:yes gene_type:complete
MARKRNSERLGAPRHPEDTSSTAAAVATQSNDIFSFVTPTEFVELPSQGRFYGENSTLHGRDMVEIRHMTAKEEDILTSEALLRKGLALDRMLQTLLVDQTIKLDDFLVGDKNALVVATRITGFGPDYITSLTCPNCSNINETEFDLTTLTFNSVEDLPDEVTRTDEGTFAFVLPTTQVTVEVRLLTTAHEKALSAATEKRKKLNLPDSRSTDLLKAVLVSVNEVTDVTMVNKFAELMPSRDSRFLRHVYEKIKPDIDLAHEFTCESCSFVGKVVMPLTAEFFWPHA